MLSSEMQGRVESMGVLGFGHAALFVLTAACGAPAEPAEVAPTEVAPTEVAPTEVAPMEVAPAEPAPSPAVPGCTEPQAPLAEDYGALVDGSAHHVEVRWTGHEWSPAAQLRMPLHHASRLEWTNLDDFTSLDAVRTERLRFSFRVRSRVIEPDPERNTFFATYSAVLEAVCRLSGP